MSPKGLTVMRSFSIFCLKENTTLLERLRFLAPFRKVILAAHQEVIVGYLVLLFFNIFGILFIVYRQFFFKDTGKKLKHLEKQLDSEATDLTTELDRG